MVEDGRYLGRNKIRAESIRGEIDFGIITVKLEEYKAIIENRFTISGIVKAKRRYGIGWIKMGDGIGYRIAFVRCVEQGQAVAQQVANDLIDDLGPKWILLVGICGGMPASEFTLGDVIIASRVHDFSVQSVSKDGVVEFDTVGAPLQKDARDIIEQLPDIELQLSNWYSPEAIGVSRPPIIVPEDLSDRKLSGSDDWKRSVIASLSRHEHRMEPLLWAAPIASGNTVMKNTDLVTMLHSGIRSMAGIEMELAGVMRAADRRDHQYPVLSIRGVSDIIGLSRNPDWTKYACHTAASLVHALVLSGELLDPGPIITSIQILSKQVSENNANPKSGIQTIKTPQTKLQEFVQLQKRQIENLPLLRYVAARESFAFLFPEVFVDPRLKLRKNPKSEEKRFVEWITQKLHKDVTISIIGPSGVGKTTSLIRIYLEYAENFFSGTADIVPIFVELRLLRGLSIFNERNIINSVAKSIGFKGRGSLPLRSDITYLFFLDGLDEYLAIASEEDRLKVAEWPVLREWHILGSRPDAFFQVLGNSELESLYTEVLELENWEVDKEVRTFVEAYFKKTKTDWKTEAKQFEDFLQRNDLTTIANTPLAITMLLVIWLYGREKETFRIRTRSDLYRRFFEDWTSLEIERDSSGIKNKSKLMDAIMETAWQMYHWQRDPSNNSTEMDLIELSEKVGTVIKVKPEILRKSRSFLSLLIVREGFHRGEGAKVRAFRHESLQAFFTAEILIGALTKNRPNLQKALQTVFTYEVNTFVRERFESEEISRSIIEDRLVDIYSKNLSQGNSDNDKKITIRNGAVYYLGRLGSEKLRILYDMVRQGEIIEHPHVKGTMASGLILMNDEMSEVDYLENLENDHPDDVRARKFHLVYYGDLPNQGPASYLVDAPEHGKDDWRRTRAAILRRIASCKERDLILRAFDLRVMRRLCETRRYRGFTVEEKVIISEARKGMEILPEYKQKLIEQETLLLMEFLVKSN